MTVTWADVQQRVGVTPDGVPGAKTLAAIARELGIAVAPLAWGARVSPAFRDQVRAIAADLGCEPDDLMTCMAWESGRTFSPSVRNMAGSGATGLIQFMPATARALGTTTDRLAALTAEQQLDYVADYFRPYRGRLRSLGDVYMAILWPAGVGKPDSFVLWDRATRPTTYRQNIGLDVNRDGAITRAECLVKLNAIKAEGLRPENFA
jgi:soluble lytic murein transglycosylase-like protein